jgi:hypothetical protein
MYFTVSRTFDAGPSAAADGHALKDDHLRFSGLPSGQALTYLEFSD